MRENGERVGFTITTFSDNRTALFAHTNFTNKAAKVGKYHVDVETFEKNALKELGSDSKIFLIDEIGKMECFSKEFVTRVQEIVDDQNLFLIGTITLSNDGIFGKIKSNPNVEVIQVTTANRNKIPEMLFEKFLNYTKNH